MKRWKLAALVTGVMTLALSSVWLRLQVVRTSYEINQQDKLIKNLLLEKETLEAELARLKSPERLERLAKSEFQMEQASVNRILSVKAPFHISNPAITLDKTSRILIKNPTKPSLALNEKN